MRSKDELERIYENLQQKRESLHVSISNLYDRLEKKKAKLKEVNRRCDKLERMLYPERKLAQTRAERFRALAKKVLPHKLYSDIYAEALKQNHISV